jgi:hypothetical protein
MMTLKRAWPLLVLLTGPLGAQTATISAGYALAHYSEQASTLSFDGSGPEASVAVGWWRLEAFGDWQQLGLVPPRGSTLQSFTMTDLTAGIRVHVAPLVSIEAGYQHRGVSPTGTAESLSALRMSARTDIQLAPGAVATVRAGYVGTFKFSGGGTAPVGLDLGLGFGYGPGSGRVQIVGRYDFERIDRHTVILTASHAVPIASSVGQLGLALRL